MKLFQLFLGLVLALLSATILQTAAQTGESRLKFDTPPSTSARVVSLSPDGDKVLFGVQHDGNRELWLLNLSSGKRQLLHEDATAPCWSPDSKGFAFTAGRGAFVRMELETGMMTTLNPDLNSTGCTWGSDGVMLVTRTFYTVVFRMSEEGDTIRAATPQHPDTVENPRFLPDGRHFTYYSGGGVFLAELGGPQPQRLFDSESGAFYVRGHFLYVRRGALLAQPFDLDTKKPRGNLFTLAQGVTGLSANTSDIAYRIGGGEAIGQFTWVDRSGKVTGTVGAPMALSIAPSLSPDNRTIALTRALGGETDIWVMDVATGELTQVTTNPARDMFPLFSADSQTIYFSSSRPVVDLYEKRLLGDEPEKLMMNTPVNGRVATSISRRFLLYGGMQDTMAIVLDSNPRTDFSIGLPGSRAEPKVSPDERWVAYVVPTSATETEVRIQRFPSGSGRSWLVGSGAFVQWNPDGKELFYIAPDGQLIAVPLDLSTDDVKVGSPQALFTPPIRRGTSVFAQYMVSKDGQRFLLAALQPAPGQLHVIRNWQARP